MRLRAASFTFANASGSVAPVPPQQKTPPQERLLAHVAGLVAKPVKFLARQTKDYFLDTKGHLEQHDQSFKDLDKKVEEILRRQAVMDEKLDNLRKEMSQHFAEVNQRFAEAKEDVNRRFGELHQDVRETREQIVGLLSRPRPRR